MKHTILLSCLLYLLSGCFKDSGNYEYTDLNAPTWLFNYAGTPIYITTYEGDTAKGTVPYRYETADSVNIIQNSRYEWRFKGILISEKKDFWMPTDSMMRMLNLPFSETAGSPGTFAIIDKATGVKHMIRTWITIRPKFYQGDWLILSENGSNSKLSFYKKKSRTGADGKAFLTYTLQNNLFETVNQKTLIGKPLKLTYSQARDISTPVGATSVVTDQGSYVVNNENFKLVSEYKDEFLDGAPANFKASNVFHSRLLTYIATPEGKLYRRLLSANWLGGKFLTQEYLIDDKGYKITSFGFGKTAQYPNTISPTYDELNRRVMMIRIAAPYTIQPVTMLAGTSHPTPVWNMPVGTEILYLGASSNKTVPSTTAMGLFTMVYNDAGGNTYMSDFVVNLADSRILESTLAANIPFPGGNITKGTKFLGTADSYRKDDFFYVKGKQLRCINRINNEDRLYMTFDSNITDVKYAAYNVNYKQICLGFENGDFFMLDISVFTEPRIMLETKVNVGGKVADIMEIRTDTFTDAY